MDSQGGATWPPWERRAASARRAARIGRGGQVAARKCQPQTGERHLKKGCRHPRDQTPAGSRAMITTIAQKTGGSIRKVCAVLGEARSSFYHASAPTATQV